MKFKKRYYWDKIYKDTKQHNSPSSFAKFCVKKYINSSKKTLLEIGCGDGRDLLFFSKKLNCIGIDKSKVVINNLRKKIEYKKKFLVYRRDLKSFKLIKLGKFDYVYMRFFLHAVNENIQNSLISSLSSVLKKGSIVMCEFRTDKDPLKKKGKKLSENETFTDHYRRFINLELFTDLLKDFSFKLIYKIEKKGLSKYKKDNPVLARVVFKK